MTKLRVADAALSTAAVLPRLRVAGVELSSVADAARRLRVAGVEMSGAAVPKILTINSSGSADFGGTVTVTAVLAPGSPTPDSWTVTQTGGQAVTLVGTGATRTFQVPAIMPGQGNLVSITFTAHLGGASSAALTVIWSCQYCLEWARVPGGSWVGSRLVV